MSTDLLSFEHPSVLLFCSLCTKHDFLFPFFFIKVVLNKRKACSFLIIGMMYLQNNVTKVLERVSRDIKDEKTRQVRESWSHQLENKQVLTRETPTLQNTPDG